jgi:hypothetical protein
MTKFTLAKIAPGAAARVIEAHDAARAQFMPAPRIDRAGEARLVAEVRCDQAADQAALERLFGHRAKATPKARGVKLKQHAPKFLPWKSVELLPVAYPDNIPVKVDVEPEDYRRAVCAKLTKKGDLDPVSEEYAAGLERYADVLLAARAADEQAFADAVAIAFPRRPRAPNAEPQAHRAGLARRAGRLAGNGALKLPVSTPRVDPIGATTSRNGWAKLRQKRLALGLKLGAKLYDANLLGDAKDSFPGAEVAARAFQLAHEYEPLRPTYLAMETFALPSRARFLTVDNFIPPAPSDSLADDDEGYDLFDRIGVLDWDETTDAREQRFDIAKRLGAERYKRLAFVLLNGGSFHDLGVHEGTNKSTARRDFYAALKAFALLGAKPKRHGAIAAAMPAATKRKPTISGMTAAKIALGVAAGLDGDTPSAAVA